MFGWLKRAGNLGDAEMLRTFNCGIGLVLVVAAGEADAVLAALKAAGEAPFIDRRDRARPRREVVGQGQRRGAKPCAIRAAELGL